MPKVIVALFSGVEDPLSLTPGAQLRILRSLVNGPQSLKELGSQLGMGPSSTTQMVNRLATSGLIVRRMSEMDRRVREVELSELGRQLIENRIRARVCAGAKILARVPESVATRLVEALEALIVAAGEAKE
jgi:DNA-binding MarR family transcriptional regulator